MGVGPGVTIRDNEEITDPIMNYNFSLLSINLLKTLSC